MVENSLWEKAFSALVVEHESQFLTLALPILRLMIQTFVYDVKLLLIMIM